MYQSNLEKTRNDIGGTMVKDYVVHTTVLTETEIIQQLWECLRRGYSYSETQIHMSAFRDGKTTEKKVVVVEKGE